MGVNAEVCRGSGTPLLFLHGWGGSALSFGGAFDYFASRGRTCAALDFPPFGASDPPPPDWSLSDYVRLTAAAADALGLGRFIPIGHSFGGRVAIRLAAETDRTEKLVLVSAAGLKPRRGLRYRLRRLAFRRDKARGRDVTKYYSPDWLAMPEYLRGVFARIVGEDLTPCLDKINCPTLIVWGRRDLETPPYMARRLKRGIKRGKLVFLEGGHFAYAENHTAFASALDSFLN